MKPEDEHKTAIKTHHEHYELKVVSYPLTSAPAIFQGLMNIVLGPFLRWGVLVFIDDILVYSQTLEEHVERFKEGAERFVSPPIESQTMQVCVCSVTSDIFGACYQSRRSGHRFEEYHSCPRLAEAN